MTISLSGKDLIAQFGTPAELRDLAARYGLPLSYAQIRKWQDRDAISSDGIAALVLLADTMQKRIDLLRAVRGQDLW